MADNDRLVELMSQMLEEQRLTNKRLDGLSGDIRTLISRVDKLEEQQHITNTLLQQHSRDLSRIAEFLSERVPHWGDDVIIESKKGSISGTLKKTG
jgi:hypothetical protein